MLWILIKSGSLKAVLMITTVYVFFLYEEIRKISTFLVEKSALSGDMIQKFTYFVYLQFLGILMKK